MKLLSTQELLPEDLVWAESGHVSDIALTAMADGEGSLLPLPVLAHVEGCRICTEHLGNAALLSLHTEGEFSTLLVASEDTAPAPLPRAAIGLGLLVALLGSWPSLRDHAAILRRTIAFVTHEAPALAGGLGTLGGRLFGPANPVGLVLTYGASVLLMGIGFGVVRWLPKKEGFR